jgi:GR25 family glycosyltransferase involved in LPS biosynthesis
MWDYVLGILLIIFILLIGIFDSFKEKKITRVVVINLDKNTKRMENIQKHWDQSDFVLDLERFPAVVGANLDPAEHVTPEALEELTETEQYGYRSKHHQLTRGAIGCYLSHVRILKQMKPGDIYFILEDDAMFRPSIQSEVKRALRRAPGNWDMILLGYNNYKVSERHGEFDKVRSFWGTCGYLINYKGTQKFLEESGPKMDCQIDSLMGWMAASEKLNVWALQKRAVFTSPLYQSDIQYPIKINGVDAFTYRDKILQL